VPTINFSNQNLFLNDRREVKYGFVGTVLTVQKQDCGRRKLNYKKGDER